MIFFLFNRILIFYVFFSWFQKLQMQLQKECDPIANYVVILKSVHDNVSLTLRFFCVPLPTQFQSLFSLTN